MADVILRPGPTRCLRPLPWTTQISGLDEYCVWLSTKYRMGREEPSGRELRSPSGQPASHDGVERPVSPCEPDVPSTFVGATPLETA